MAIRYMSYSQSPISSIRIRSGLLAIALITYVCLLSIVSFDLADTPVFATIVAGVGVCAVGIALTLSAFTAS